MDKVIDSYVDEFRYYYKFQDNNVIYYEEVIFTGEIEVGFYLKYDSSEEKEIDEMIHLLRDNISIS